MGDSFAGRTFEVTWEAEMAARPDAVWDAVTARADGWLWPIRFEPRVGGAERGLTPGGGSVAVWDPPRRFVTRAEEGGWFNELEYRFEPQGAGTYVRFSHRTIISVDDEFGYDVQLDSCRRHTDFYRHSRGVYATHFAGRDATYVCVDAPDVSAHGGTAVLRRALGIAEHAAVGDAVRLAPDGIAPIDGVVDYVTPEFLGVRSATSLVRIYGRDAWGWPVSVAHHVFDPAVDAGSLAASWRAFLASTFRLSEGRVVA